MTSASDPSGSPIGPLEGDELAVSITATDLERSLAWYESVLGFRVAQQYEREGKAVAASLAAGCARAPSGGRWRGIGDRADPHTVGCADLPGARPGRLPLHDLVTATEPVVA